MLDENARNVETFFVLVIVSSIAWILPMGSCPLMICDKLSTTQFFGTVTLEEIDLGILEKYFQYENLVI